MNRSCFSLAAVGALVFLVAWTCATAHADVLREDALLSAARSASDRDDLLSLQAVEPIALEATANASRHGDRLVLRLSSGVSRAFDDSSECKAEALQARCEKYRLIVHARTRGVFVVAKLYSESAEYVLVDDRSGDDTVLRRFPIFSPSGEHVLVLLINDELVGFAIQIWRRKGYRFALDWSGSPYTNGMYTSYRFIGWPSEGTIELQSETSFEPPKQNVSKRFNLRRTSRDWQVVEIS
jgi:hypothetical protein